jgi:hypothetical protein
VLVVSAAERGGGGQYFVPRALGRAFRAFRAFWLGEPADCCPPTITVEQVHGAARPAADAARIAQLAGLLSDRARAELPETFPQDAAAADAPGLYAWWGDEEGVRVIGGALGGQVGSLLYVGQAGATSRVAGKRSNATLDSRIRGQHIRAQTRASTFARTMAAVLREPTQLEPAAPGLLTEHSRQRLSCWICEHLQIAVVPVPAPDTLTAVEDAVLAALDPPLNLDAMPRTPRRRRLSELRSELGRAGPSALPAVTRQAAGRSSSAAASLRPAADGFDEVWDRIRRHAGDTFTLVRGQQFTYQVSGNRRSGRTTLNRASCSRIRTSLHWHGHDGDDVDEIPSEPLARWSAALQPGELRWAAVCDGFAILPATPSSRRPCFEVVGIEGKPPDHEVAEGLSGDLLQLYRRTRPRSCMHKLPANESRVGQAAVGLDSPGDQVGDPPPGILVTFRRDREQLARPVKLALGVLLGAEPSAVQRGAPGAVRVGRQFQLVVPPAVTMAPGAVRAAQPRAFQAKPTADARRGPVRG